MAEKKKATKKKATTRKSVSRPKSTKSKNASSGKKSSKSYSSLKKEAEKKGGKGAKKIGVTATRQKLAAPEKKPLGGDPGMSQGQQTLLTILATLLVAILLYNVVQVGGITSTVGPKIDEALEAARPSEISIIGLSDSSCHDCGDVQATIDAIKAANVEVLDEEVLEFDSTEAKNLISQYGIAKIPAVIVTGEIDREVGFESDMEARGEGLVFEAPGAPYTDAVSGRVQGLVEVVFITNPDCEDCFSMTAFGETLISNGVTVSKQQTLDYQNNAAQSFISRLDISVLPAMIVSRDLAAYPQIEAQLVSGLTAFRSDDGDYVVLSPNPPFYDLDSSEIVGLVSLTYVTDDSCTECYDVEVHSQVLPQFGINPTEEVFVDVGTPEGKDLVEQYNITNVPTILMSSDAKRYPALMNVWPQVGLVLEDGTLVFTRTSSMGAYRDLSTGLVIGG